MAFLWLVAQPSSMAFADFQNLEDYIDSIGLGSIRVDEKTGQLNSFIDTWQSDKVSPNLDTLSWTRGSSINRGTISAGTYKPSGTDPIYWFYQPWGARSRTTGSLNIVEGKGPDFKQVTTCVSHGISKKEEGTLIWRCFAVDKGVCNSLFGNDVPADFAKAGVYSQRLKAFQDSKSYLENVESTLIAKAESRFKEFGATKDFASNDSKLRNFPKGPMYVAKDPISMVPDKPTDAQSIFNRLEHFGKMCRVIGKFGNEQSAPRGLSQGNEPAAWKNEDGYGVGAATNEQSAKRGLSQGNEPAPWQIEDGYGYGVGAATKD